MNKSLISMSDDEFYKTLTEEFNQPKFRVEQLKNWLIKGAGYDEMKNIPSDLTQKLKEKYPAYSLEFEYKTTEERTQTTKYLLKTLDGILIECVALIYDGKLSVCVSTQAGCAMGCKFCSSTVGGLIRNLSSDEMVSQLLLVSRDQGLVVRNVVLMGSGEPLNNYDNVKNFIRYICSPDTLNLGKKHITLSTCGIPGGIDKMREDKLFVNLSLSLHCAVSEIRKEIMPVERAYPVKEVFKKCCEFRKESSRRITLEYCVIEGTNDTDECAKALFDLLKGTDAEVNIIDYNKKDGYLIENSRSAADDFANKLKKYRINYTIRRKLGSSINAACGQLKSSYVKGTTL